MQPYGWLALLGVVLGALGTMIGAGGGFLLVPLLLLLYPHEKPEIITSIALAVVFLNAASGSWAYARMGRIDYRSAALFSLATAPGAILGALSTTALPRRLFDALLGCLMLTAATYLLLHKRTAEPDLTHDALTGTPAEGAGAACAPTPDAPDPLATVAAHAEPATQPAETVSSTIVRQPAVRPRVGMGMALSVAVGYVSGLLGIGGGIIHVPLLVRVLRFPVHIATATSHLILAIIALCGTAAHVATGTFTRGYRRTIAIGIGVIVGAQLGAYVSSRLHGDWIIRTLAVALAFVGLRVLLLACSPHVS